ncbi:MAG: glycoside hydrolase family 88 protein [Planctomycetales bacterium]|nr:glycoside hydrolase family 88 protein [Planctomycetales bacterium]
MIHVLETLRPADLTDALAQFWNVSGEKILAIEASSNERNGTPVFTVAGRYAAQGWTEWTQGFQFGSALLQFDATDDEEFLDIGRRNTWRHMPAHVTHFGVHDHGFNNVSTYGALRRLMLEGRMAADDAETALYELALQASGTVQAARWSTTADGDGYIYSFNGPHSLFADTIRSLRSLMLAHRLGQRFLGENDVAVSLLGRAVEHARTTARYNVYFGESRDAYDVRGRVAHESIFNTNDGRYRCPSTQQGYSPFSTWTRGLAWIMLGYAEELEAFAHCSKAELEPFGGRDAIEAVLRRAACAASDFYLAETPTDGIPYWDTGAPGLARLGDYLDRPADPTNDLEPVDSSAAAIAAQGLLRLGNYLTQCGEGELGARYWQAGLTVSRSLLRAPYLSEDPQHEGLLLHTIYHRPRGWDYIPPGAKQPRGEACMWGDYHLRELALYLQRIVLQAPYYTFFGPISDESNP